MEEGGQAHLTCQARGAPNVTFQWTRKDGRSVEPGTDSLKYELEYTQVSCSALFLSILFLDMRLFLPKYSVCLLLKVISV